MKTLFEKMRANRKVAEAAKAKREERFKKQRDAYRGMQNDLLGGWNSGLNAGQGMNGWFGYSGDAGGPI